MRLPAHPEEGIAKYRLPFGSPVKGVFDPLRHFAEKMLIAFLYEHPLATEADVRAYLAHEGIDPIEAPGLLEVMRTAIDWGRSGHPVLVDTGPEVAPDFGLARAAAGRVRECALDLSAILEGFVKGEFQEDLYIDFANTVNMAVADMSRVVFALKVDYRDLRAEEQAWGGKRRLSWPQGGDFTSDMRRCAPELEELINAAGRLIADMARADRAGRVRLAGNVAWLLFRVLGKAGFNVNELGYPDTWSASEGEPFYCDSRNLIDLYSGPRSQAGWV